MSEEVTIGRRYAIVIPKRVRNRLGLKEGQRALVREEAGRIIVEPLPEDPYNALAEAIGAFAYDEEEKHEPGAEEWLNRVASAGH